MPTPPFTEVLQFAGVIASQVAFAVERTRTEQQAGRGEERLCFALDAVSMGTWDWDLLTNEVRWSDNLARIHGLPDGSFDGTFASFERGIHPDDRGRVHASIARALRDGAAPDVEYRIVAPDGTVRWCVGKGHVEHAASGRGIAPHFLPFVFDRFRQADSQSTRAHGGLGLGLAIAKHLIEQQGETIDAHSDGEDTGTRVVIRLPTLAAVAETMLPSRDPSAPEARFDALTFLIVDDQQDSREMLATLLE